MLSAVANPTLDSESVFKMKIGYDRYAACHDSDLFPTVVTSQNKHALTES
jgi:hypothetical protein